MTRGYPLDAELTFAWASDLGDPDELAKVITFDPDVREKAAAMLAVMPEPIRTQYPTSELFYGLLYAVEACRCRRRERNSSVG